MKFGQIVEGVSHMIFQMELILLHLNKKEFLKALSQLFSGTS